MNPVPGFQHTCQTCGVTETMEHILLRCKAKGRKEAWTLTKTLWKRRKQPWTDVALEDIMTAGMGQYPTQENAKRKESSARLWRIIIPETAHLIWKLRCERVIGHADEDGWEHSRREIIRRWYATINRRLQIDMIATNKRFGHLAKNRALVWSTWTGTIGDELGLQEDWTRVPRVLVGIDPGICVEVDPG
ncbi:uncharacterized protein C8Q71DRAFT_711257 [Rhodofomes roseus]|uniref:Reverse transcriptase zinc-binding domain-containing protein n=1 Tax=Rhodofomes roseus TaxID=34475 RepID=A0ABQ8KC02_9APHY|nr:uncharacterized protein C8Q71DRAFT_711257 [Rhodofomes roseus]KAH9834580.1 hypothetical protein C8Q71DRAFT_711257 [Rhodofomes roseus]